MFETTEDIKKGNPVAQNRYRWQTWGKYTDEPYESDWCQFKKDAIRCAEKYLIRQFNKFQKDDIVVKIFNEMNYRELPMIITLEDALRNQDQQ